MTNSRFTLSLATAALAAAIGLTACTSGPEPIQDNSGKIINTQPGEQLLEEQFVGKWDIDGERTNNAQGQGGVTAIPSDILKDTLGKGWRFERGGVLKIDAVVGSKTGSWRIVGKDGLAVTTPEGDQSFTAQFRAGYLYLKRADGKWFVFERDKYFGL